MTQAPSPPERLGDDPVGLRRDEFDVGRAPPGKPDSPGRQLEVRGEEDSLRTKSRLIVGICGRATAWRRMTGRGRRAGITGAFGA